MPTLAKSNQQLEAGFPTSTAYSQPWWQGLGNNDMPSSGHQETESVATATLHLNGTAEGNSKDTDTNSALQSGLNGSNSEQEQQQVYASQMELVGHSIMLASYRYADPQYRGMLAYGAPVHPHLIGYHPARMPLPLEMEEEPVYVNAKQYHGILRRRQIRAKAELEKKLVKNRKPYLHESRHQHAMRRARGSGGRFLNSKKLDGNAKDTQQSKSGEIASAQSCSSASAQLSSNSNGISNQHDDGASTLRSSKQVLPNGFHHDHGLASFYAQSTRRDLEQTLLNWGPQGPSASR